GSQKSARRNSKLGRRHPTLLSDLWLPGGEMGLLEGKRAVIFGVANERSIAWAISEVFHAEGAELAFTYAGEVLEKRVRPLAEGSEARIILPCDVTKDEEIEKVFATLKQE